MISFLSDSRCFILLAPHSCLSQYPKNHPLSSLHPCPLLIFFLDVSIPPISPTYTPTLADSLWNIDSSAVSIVNSRCNSPKGICTLHLFSMLHSGYTWRSTCGITLQGGGGGGGGVWGSAVLDLHELMQRENWRNPSYLRAHMNACAHVDAYSHESSRRTSSNAALPVDSWGTRCSHGSGGRKMAKLD